MQVTEISAHGLRREFKVVLPAADLASRLEGELVGMSTKVRLNGFRPGKVPMAHLRRLYGRSVMSEIVQNAVNEANRKIVEDNGLRLALEPKIDLSGDQAEVERAMEAKGDLAFTVAVETVPVFSTGSFGNLALERQVAEVSDADVDTAVERMADQNRVFEPRTNDNAWAERGDRVTIDFVGRIDGEPFEGGQGEAVDVVLGSGTFIPGFEDQLTGAHIGEDRSVEITFPENYTAEMLAGRTALFDVKVKGIALPLPLIVDDAFASGFGFETLDKLKEAIRGRMKAEIDRVSRDRLKRVLLDALDKTYDFLLPDGLVAQEFGHIWNQILAEQKRTGRSFEAEKTTEEAARADYRRIAERRVRLGLVLAQVGENAGVKVEDNEIGQALVELVRRYPGQEKQVWEHYRNNAQALNELKAPLFEDKVVDFIVAQAQVTDRIVSRTALFKMHEADEAADMSDATPALALVGEQTPDAAEPTHEAPQSV